MKECVRRYFWWIGITRDIDRMVQTCEGCIKFKKHPTKTPLCPWPFARRPMERVHIDYCEYRGKMILVMVDAYSKKIWTQLMTGDTTANRTLAVLYGWFCEETGIPTTLVSDNGPQFHADEFQAKMAKWGIKHILTPPYHPSSNGLAERSVGIVKSRLKRMGSAATPIELFVNLKYICRVHGLTPHRSTGRCPYEMIREGEAPSLFPQLTGGATQRSERESVKICGPRLKKKVMFSEGEKVIVYDNRFHLSAAGEILEVLGNNNYLVDIDNKGVTHVSGDVISKRRYTVQQQQQQQQRRQAEVTPVSVDRVGEEDDMSDTSSISDIETGEDEREIGYLVQEEHGENQGRRRRRRAEMLDHNQIIRQRLRPRR